MKFIFVISYIYSVDVVSRTVFCRSLTCSNPLPSVCSMADLWSVAIWRAEVICFCKIFRACSQFAVVSLNLKNEWRRKRTRTRKRMEHREYNWNNNNNNNKKREHSIWNPENNSQERKRKLTVLWLNEVHYEVKTYWVMVDVLILILILHIILFLYQSFQQLLPLYLFL